MKAQVRSLYSDVDHELDPSVTERMRHGRAENTQKTYAKFRRAFEAWCGETGRQHLPATVATVVTYAHELTTRGWAPSSIGVHLAAITSWHEEQGLPRPDPRRAQLLVRAYARERAAAGYRPRRVDPVTVEHLRALVAACDTASTAGLRDRALILLGFALMARRSILGRIEIADLRVRPAGLEVAVRYDKRQPTGRTVVVPRLPAGDPLCVVAAVAAWRARLADYGITGGALLRKVDRHGVPVRAGGLLGAGVHDVFERAVARAGLSDLDLTPHSLRAGAATEAYGAGADVLDIARHGGWTPGSAALWSYIRGRDAWHNNPIGRALGAA